MVHFAFMVLSPDDISHCSHNWGLLFPWLGRPASLHGFHQWRASAWGCLLMLSGFDLWTLLVLFLTWCAYMCLQFITVSVPSSYDILCYSSLCRNRLKRVLLMHRPEAPVAGAATMSRANARAKPAISTGTAQDHPNWSRISCKHKHS